MRNPTVASEGPLTPRLGAILEDVERGAARRVRRVLYRRRRTNLVSEVQMIDGQVLIVKQGTSEAARGRFATAHAASILLRGVGIEMPATQLLLNGEPVLVYRRIDRRTLHECWPSASETGRLRLLESWGALLHRLHSFELRGVGPLADPALRSADAGEYLRRDLAGRLIPILETHLPQAVDIARTLAASVEALQAARSVVVHNDVFDQNVLCDDAACTGLLDFEDAFAGPPEADFAKLELLHGPLFGQPWSGTWLEALRAGYEHTLDPRLVAAFRTLALLNMSWHGTTIGLADHSRMLVRAAAAEAARIDEAILHTEAIRAAGLS